MSTSRWVSPQYLKAKPKIRVLILGSYGDSALKKLEMLKIFLLSKGYLQTCLVKDFNHPTRHSGETQSAYNLRMSEYWIPKADVPIFVFFPNVDNSGVGYELKHLIDHHYDMAWRSIIGISMNSALQISSLLDALIQRWSDEIQQIRFNNDTELLDKGVKGALTNLLEKLYFRTIGRAQGEWEMSK